MQYELNDESYLMRGLLIIASLRKVKSTLIAESLSAFKKSTSSNMPLVVATPKLQNVPL